MPDWVQKFDVSPWADLGAWFGVTSLFNADLSEVVPQVVDVVGSDEPEGHGRVGIDAAGLVFCTIGDVGNDVRKVPVVGRPELDQLAPGASIVVLDLNPVLLSVTRKVKVTR